MLVDPPQPQSFTEPSTEPPTQDIVDLSLENDANQTPSEPIQDEAASPNTLPSHRARTANPLVKMVDDFAALDGAISVKARLQGRNGTSSETPVAGPSSSPTRKSGRKPGPGRSSAGIVAKNTSSLLTFEKGALKTVKGKFTAPVEEEDKAEGSSGDVPMIPAVPPTSDELLRLGGFDVSAAEALDDFEDETSPAEVPENNSSIQQRFVFLYRVVLVVYLTIFQSDSRQEQVIPSRDGNGVFVFEQGHFGLEARDYLWTLVGASALRTSDVSQRPLP